MLKTLHVLHTPDLLHVLASMGHGDEIALVDRNFLAASMAQRLASRRSAADGCIGGLYAAPPTGRLTPVFSSNCSGSAR
jgi:hypothetical protein